MQNPLSETYDMLVEWGHWVRTGGIGLQYRSPLGILELMCVGSTSRAPQIDDDTALKVDAAIAKLKAKNPDLFEVLKMTFWYQMSHREIAKELKISKASVSNYLASGVAWVDSKLSDDLPVMMTFIA